MKKIFTHALILMLCCITFELSAQVGLNNANITSSGSAMLDIFSTDQGLLIPRISAVSRDLIPSPATGLLIYNTTTNLFNYYNGSFWYQIEATFVSTTTGTISPGGGVAISATPGQQPDNSAMLDANDPSRGFLITRTTPAAIASPENGLIIYDQSTGQLKYFFDNEWFPICAVSTGNSGTGGSQNSIGVAISTTGASPDPSAILEVISPDKGVLIPRLTSLQRDAILPVTGLTIFNISTKTIEFFNGSGWLKMNVTMPAEVIINADNLFVCVGTVVNFSAAPINGGDMPFYQWKVNGFTASAGTNSTYNYSPNNNDVVTCEMTSSSPCATGNPAVSNPITITVNPLLLASVTIDAVPPGEICDGTSVTFTATPVDGGTAPSYQWMNGTGPIAGATNSTYTSSTLTSGNVISVVMTSGFGVPFNTTVEGIIVSGQSQYYNAENIITVAETNPFTIESGGGAEFVAGSKISFKPGTTVQSGGYMHGRISSATMPCLTGSPATSNQLVMTIKPQPAVDPVGNAAYCHGASTSAITFSGPVAGTTFAWVNNTTSIGLPANGTGNIPSFMATNTGTSPVIATITVTPTANGCTGTPLMFTITVYPTTTVNPVNNAAYCNGAATTVIDFGSPVAGTTFAWVNDTPSIGLAAIGSG
ncbi:MAG: hypothetical protein Q8M08_11925, partial [Bacteroidales bacterium]|nr:hypothetical protein [Bacteroidales bacterium]